MHIDAVMDGRTMVAPSDPTPHSPIHIDDMKWMLEPLLDAASTTACITNWCGDDVTTVQDWVRDAAAWSGRDAQPRHRTCAGQPRRRGADPTRRRSITGPCRTTFADTFRTLFPDLTALGDGPLSVRQRVPGIAPVGQLSSAPRARGAAGAEAAQRRDGAASTTSATPW